MERFRARDLVVHTKPDRTPVTEADHAVEEALRAQLARERPDDGIVGEEYGVHVAGNRRWIVDPIDGTKSFLRGSPPWATLLGLEVDGDLVLGMVSAPALGRRWWATRGGGAFANGRRLQVNDPVPMDRALLATGFGYSPERRAAQGALIAGLLPRVRDIRRIGSAALDLCAVAAGAVDGYLEEGVKAWDVAAGSLIVREAGGIVTVVTPTGDATGCLAAGPALHAELAAELDG